MVRFKRNGDKLLNVDIVSPEMPYALFSDDLAEDVKDMIVSTLNHGGKMLEIYQNHRLNQHIVNIVDMIKLLEDEYRAYDLERFEAKRRAK